MTIIFNVILKIQYFPKPWKLAQIKMLHKPGKDPHQTASYRPISLLPVFSKILEKIMYYRIKTIIEIKKLISEHQFGFRNKHSTIEHMHRLINEIIVALENKEYCTALFMDIEKAFDKIKVYLLVVYLSTCKIKVLKVYYKQLGNNSRSKYTN